MLAYLLRRLVYAAIMLVLVSFVGFFIIDLPQGDYLQIRLAELRARGDVSADTRIEGLRVRYALDKPFLERYVLWVSNFVRGDFGEAFEYERPVSEIIGQRLGNTVILALAVLLTTWIIAIPLGVFSAVRQYSIYDQVITTVSFIGLGVPGFLLALLIMYVAVVQLNQDVGGFFSREFVDAPWSLARVLDLLAHIWIPVLIGSITGIAGLIRIMRANLLDTLGQPFIESARARGLDNRTVNWKHGVRIAINPLIVILGSEALPNIIVGNALVSIVMNLPTVDPLFVNALQKQDMYLAGTILIFFTFLLVIGNLLSDLLLMWADPRIRLG